MNFSPEAPLLGRAHIGMIGSDGMAFCLDFAKYPAQCAEIWLDAISLRIVRKRPVSASWLRTVLFIWQSSRRKETSNPRDRKIIFGFRTGMSASEATKLCQHRAGTALVLSGGLVIVHSRHFRGKFKTVLKIAETNEPTWMLPPPSRSVSVQSDLGPFTLHFIKICWWTVLVLVFSAGQPLNQDWAWESVIKMPNTTWSEGGVSVDIVSCHAPLNLIYTLLLASNLKTPQLFQLHSGSRWHLTDAHSCPGWSWRDPYEECQLKPSIQVTMCKLLHGSMAPPRKASLISVRKVLSLESLEALQC